jgi:glucose/arabinose dehydrogenase
MLYHYLASHDFEKNRNPRSLNCVNSTWEKVPGQPFTKKIISMKKASRFSFLLLTLLFRQVYAQLPDLQLDLFSSGYSSPVDIATCGDSRLFIVEKGGKIWICDNLGNKSAQPFLNITNKVLSTGNEQGLLGLAFHPDYASNGYFYVNYINKQGNTIVARYQVSPTNPNKAVPSTGMKLFSVKQPFANHNGGCLKFGPDGYLYIGMGDGGSAGDPQGNGQKTTTLLGKMLRIDVDGGTPYAIPASNPFVGMPGFKGEIWALGTRNPWRFSFDRLTGDLWIGEVGQGDWEEVDYQLASSSGGENYGWRCYEGNHPFNTTGCGPASNYDFPIAEYAHSGGDCSITGGFVYRGAEYPNMYGKYIYVDYCSGKFRTIYHDGTSWQNILLLTSSIFQYVTFGEDLNGELYVAKLGDGNIYHVTDDSPGPPMADFKIVRSNPSRLSALKGKDFSYQWMLNGQEIKGASAPEFIPLVSGNYQLSVTNASGISATSLSQWVEVNKDDVAALVKSTSGENSLLESASYSLYPNPNKGQFTLEWISMTEKPCEVSIYNSMGQVILHEKRVPVQGLNQWSFTLSGVASDTYFMLVTTSEGVIRKKFSVE